MSSISGDSKGDGRAPMLMSESFGISNLSKAVDWLAVRSSELIWREVLRVVEEQCS